MNILRCPISAFLIIFASSPYAAAMKHDELSKMKDAQLQPSMAGMWRIEVERTNKANSNSRKKMKPETISQLNSMTLQLKTSGRFEQAICASHKITGDWKFKLAEAKTAVAQKIDGRLTLVPDNLESHTDMHFDVFFIEPNLIKADPPRGLGAVFFQKDESEPEDVERVSSKKQQTEKAQGDRAAKMFANVAGCLGARSIEKDGVQFSFVWFEDRKAIVSWCKSQKHISTAARIMEIADPGIKMREPLAAAPDEQGPFLVIMTLKPKENRDDGFPLEQLSMEIYKPVDGGMFIGNRFAPKKLNVNGLREIQPK